MLTIRLFLLLLFTASFGFSAIPDKLEGFIYYEVEDTVPRIVSTRAIVLAASGTFTGLFQTAAGARVAGGYALSDLEDGTFTYQKLDESTAELTLSFLLSGGGTSKRTLKFDSDTSGFIPASNLPTGSLGVSFRLMPASSRAPLTNCANRSFVRPGGMTTTGFVIAGGVSRWVLVRAVGPTLSAFGVAAPLRNPRLSVLASSGTAVSGGLNDDWSSASALAISRTSAAVGAFPLNSNSQDAAVILSLSPGAYTAQVSSPNAEDTGEALIEVYLIP